MTTADEQSGDWTNYGDGDGLPPILGAARDAFVEAGYYGSTIRGIAERCGLSVPGLYHHYPSKQALLVELLEHAMEELLGRSRVALENAGQGPAARLSALVGVLVLYHTHRRELAFLAQSEIRALEPEFRRSYLAKRDAEQRLVDEEVIRGVESKVFSVEQPLAASRAIVTMCTAIANWYRPGGPLGPDQVVEIYTRYALDLLNVRKSGRAASRRGAGT